MTSIYHRSHLPADIASFAGFALNHPPPLHLSYTSFYLFQKTIWNQPSTFTSPLLTHPKIILKFVHYTISFGNLVKVFWTIPSDGGISFSPKPFGSTQWSCNSHKITHLEHPKLNVSSLLQLINEKTIWWIQKTLLWVRYGAVIAFNTWIVSVR